MQRVVHQRERGMKLVLESGLWGNLAGLCDNQ